MTRLPRPAAVAAPATALLLAAATAVAPAAGAQAPAAPPLAAVFDAVPADAQVVLAVPTLRGFSERIAAFAADTGLDGHSPELADVLGSLKQEMGLNQGLDDRGALLVVISEMGVAIDAALDDNPGNDHLEPSMLLLVPVSDYGAFVTGLGGDPAAEGAQVRLGRGKGFARQVPGYAVIGETAEGVAGYVPGAAGQAITDAVGPQTAPWFARGQSLVYVDVAALAPSLKSAVARGAAEIVHEMQEGAPAQSAMLAPVFKAYAGLLNAMIDGTHTLGLALDLSDQGVGVAVGGRLNEGSTVANMMRPAGADAAGQGGSLLNRLPDQPYLFANAADLTRFDTDALADAVQTVVEDLKVAAGQGEVGGLPIGQIVDMYTEMSQVSAGATAMGSVIYAPDPAAMMSGGFFKQLNLTQTPDPQGVLNRQQAVMAKMNEVTIQMPAAGQDAAGAGNAMSFETTYTANALEIDGTAVDQFQIKTVLPPAMMQQFGPMAALMGNAGTGGYLAAKDGHVITTSVTDPQLITQGLKALEADNGLGAAASLTALREAQLPADAAMESWISVAGIANTVNPFMLMFAGGAQLDVPAGLAPVAMGAAVAPEGMVMRLFVPTDVVRFGIETLDQFKPQGQRNAPLQNAPHDHDHDHGRRAPRAL